MLEIPELSLVVLIGACGSGRRTFAATHLPPETSLSAGLCSPSGASGRPDREKTVAPGFQPTPAGLPGEPANGSELATLARGFFSPEIAELHRQLRKRLASGQLTFVIAPTLRFWQRRALLDLAKRAYTQAVAIVFDLPEDLLQRRNQAMGEQGRSPAEIQQQVRTLRQALPDMKHEGFHRVYILRTAAQVDAAQVSLCKMPSNFKELRGPFDIIGDVHGCADELEELLARLSYQRLPLDEGGETPHLDQTYPFAYRHPQGRMAIFVGDLVDRGPRILHTCDIVRNMQASAAALCVPGNHDDKFMRLLKGHKVKIENGLETSLAALQALPEEQRGPYQQALRDFFERLPSHLVLNRGYLVVAHAGIKSAMIGRDAARVRDFTLYGETTGETDPYGLPVRLNWAEHYHGRGNIVYGHTPVAEPAWQNNTINIDTGCVYGGKLTALRYPEMELVSVPARREYAKSKRPFLTPNRG